MIGLEMLESSWTNAWLRNGIEWRNTPNAPVRSVTAIWESWSPNERPKCPCRRSMDGAWNVVTAWRGY
jgi:hypothetical protein